MRGGAALDESRSLGKFLRRLRGCCGYVSQETCSEEIAAAPGYWAGGLLFAEKRPRHPFLDRRGFYFEYIGGLRPLAAAG